MNGARPVICAPWHSLHAGRPRAGSPRRDQRFAAVAQRRRRRRCERRRVRQVERGEVVGDLLQIGVVEELEQAVHELVVASLVAKIAQLVEQVAGRLAGDSRVVAVGSGTPLLAMAAGAGDDALGDRVLERRGGARRLEGGDAREHERAAREAPVPPRKACFAIERHRRIEQAAHPRQGSLKRRRLGRAPRRRARCRRARAAGPRPHRRGRRHCGSGSLSTCRPASSARSRCRRSPPASPR